jgi:hypothetical protein
MSTVIFDDDFSSYTPGTYSINNFYSSKGAATGEIVSFNTMTGSTPAPGFYERLGQGYVLSAQLRHEEASPSSDTQIVWAGWNSSIPLIQLNNANISAGTGSAVIGATPICSLAVNPDYTMSITIPSTNGQSLYAGGVIIATTDEQAVFDGVWQYYQVNFSIFPVILGSLTYIGVSGTLAINGIQRCVGTGTTNGLVTSVYTGAANVNQWVFYFSQGQGAGFLADITGYVGAPLPAFSSWPHQGTKIDALYTQSLVETAKLPDPSVRHGRVTQGVAELVKAPPTTVRHSRVTQGVVEVILRRTGGGWYVYEA